MGIRFDHSQVKGDLTLIWATTACLDRIDLVVTPGAPTLVVGPNGAGKSTLLRVCMGLTRPSAGRITWGGRPDARPTRRAFLFQRPVMLRRSAAAIDAELASLTANGA